LAPPADERLPAGTPVRSVDDPVFFWWPFRWAREALVLGGIEATTAPAISWTYRADASIDELTTAGLAGVTCLARQSLIPG
jgi:hypothetical protein